MATESLFELRRHVFVRESRWKLTPAIAPFGETVRNRVAAGFDGATGVERRIEARDLRIPGNASGTSLHAGQIAWLVEGCQGFEALRLSSASSSMRTRLFEREAAMDDAMSNGIETDSQFAQARDEELDAVRIGRTAESKVLELERMPPVVFDAVGTGLRPHALERALEQAAIAFEYAELTEEDPELTTNMCF